MKRMKLGKTNLDINRFGFGGIPIQRVSEKEAIDVVVHSINKGVDFIDTARLYTTSEKRIGMALKEIDKNKKIVLASKSPAKTKDKMLEDIEKSLTDLQVDFIDLYQCHFIKDRDDYNNIIAPNGALEGLIQAKEKGLIGHYGATSHSIDLLDKVVDDELFETIMICFSFLEYKADDVVIPKALKKDIGVIAMKSLSGGVIPRPDIALKYVLMRDNLALIPGVETIDLFDQNYQVYESSWELNLEEWGEIEKIKKELSKSFCRRCDYCLPCPEEVPIQQMMGLKIAIKRFGTHFLDQAWVKPFIEKGRNCSQCEECITRCPYALNIPKMIEENLEWVDAECPGA